MIITNNASSYSGIMVTYDNQQICIKKGESKIINTDNVSVCFTVTPFEKNYTTINWLDLLLFGFIDSKGVINNLNCITTVTVEAAENREEQVVTITDLTAKNKNDYHYNAVCASSDNCNIVIRHKLRDASRQKKKTKRLYFWFASDIIEIIILLILTIVFEDFLLPICALVLFIFFFVPTMRAIRKSKKFFSDEYADEVLKEESKKVEIE